MKQRMQIKGIAALIAVTLLALSMAQGATTTMPIGGRGYVPGRFIVRVTPGARISQMMSSAASSGSLAPLLPSPTRAGFESLSRYYIFTPLQANPTVSSVTSALGSSNVEVVEQDQYLEFYSLPTDPLFTNQWYLRNVGQSYYGINRLAGINNDQLVTKTGISGNDIHINPFYATPPPETSKVLIAIVDTGTDLKHPELAGRLWQNPGEIPGNGLDDDHNGYTDDTLGYDLSGDSSQIFNILGDNDPTDHFGHGTHLAGIVAANADGVGTVGVAPWAKIMTIKIYPNAYMSIGAAGIIYAVDNGARIINISWGSAYATVVLEDALNYARAHGVFVSIAAGNTGDNSRNYPAAFDSSFTVAAGDSHGAEASFSTFGPFVDIVAPGLDILSLRAAGTDMYAEGGEPGVRIIGPDSLYYLSDGTSMAAPCVAGAAGLIWSFRPDLSLTQLESILRMGAIDMLDPRDQGDSLVGPDSLSGYGYLCVSCSMNLLTHGGIAITSPLSRERYAGHVPIKGARVAGYTGGYLVEYALGESPSSWQTLAQGVSIPADSVLADFYQPSLNELVTFRVTDQFGTAKSVTVTYVNADSLDLVSPHAGDTLRFTVPIDVSAHGPNYDSLELFYRPLNKGAVLLTSTTREYYGGLAYTWNVSGLSAGKYMIIARGFFGGTTRSDSAQIYMSSAFAAGWPQALPGRATQTPIAADINGDGIKEIILGSLNGLCVFEPDGKQLAHFPLYPTKDMRCVPAIYDVDGDGKKDIVCTNADGLHAIRYDGTEAPGFPVAATTGSIVFGFPTPTIANLPAPITGGFEPTILFIDANDSLHAYQMDGSSHFHSLGGGFAQFNPYVTPAYYFGANELATADVSGDGKLDIIASYSGLFGLPGGVGVFQSANGQPEFNQSIPQVLSSQVVYGTVLTDLTGDSIPELVVVAQGTGQTINCVVLTRKPDGSGLMNLPGWPISFTNLSGWLGNIPMVGDLDLDGVPEIVMTFYEFDIGAVYAFRADGTPYRTIPGRPAGELFSYPATMGVPVIADLTGDQYPEIVFRTGYILPGTGQDQLVAVDHNGNLVPGFPLPTPTPKNTVISTPFAPLIDDIDGDGKVDLLYTGDGSQLFVWNYDAPSRDGKNRARLGGDDLNSHVYPATGVITGVNDHPKGLPAQFTLEQNYPNPFNPTTTISFDLPVRSVVRLDVFNILGQLVRTPLDDTRAAGHYELSFDANGLASGIYLYRLSAGNQQAVKKMVVLK